MTIPGKAAVAAGEIPGSGALGSGTATVVAPPRVAVIDTSPARRMGMSRGRRSAGGFTSSRPEWYHDCDR